MFKQTGKWLRRGMRMTFILFLCFGMWTGYVQWKIHEAEDHELQSTAEVGIVLGAALWNNAPSPALKERLNQAIQLFEEGKVQYLIVSGGMDYNGSTWTEAEGMQHYLVEKGIPANVIVMEDKARSTYENLLYSQDLMQANSWQYAVIITHDYHAARAMDIALFLKYENPQVSSTDSKVLVMPYHKARETLAFTKWTLDKLLFSITP